MRQKRRRDTPRRPEPEPKAPDDGCGRLAAPSAEGTVRRPSQFTAAQASGKPLSVDALLKHFVEDVHAGNLVCGHVPARPRDNRALLRVVQWNVNNFSGCNVGDWPASAQIVELVLSFDADVCILHEFYAWDDDDDVTARFRAAGYDLSLTETDFPTLLATRCPVAGASRSLVFEHSAGAEGRAESSLSTVRLHRAARCRTLHLPTGEDMVIYATHLNHIDGGGARREEAQFLLDDVKAQDADLPTLVVADFNQPRRRDYAPEEWSLLMRSASERGEPNDDGVAGLFEAHGFCCSLDLSHTSERNWPCDVDPPPTHWTGTAIDYSFARGLRLHGTYVVPTLLSDHFLVVSDWAAASK